MFFMELSVSNHVIVRYRERVTEDSFRAERASSDIKRIISRSVGRSPFYSCLSKLVENECKLNVELVDDNSLGAYPLILKRRKGKGRSYIVLTIYD